MAISNFSRRQLFRKFLYQSTGFGNPTDPLFEKYSRKIYKGRKYQPANIDNLSNISYRVTPVTSGLNIFNGSWTDREAMHLLKRTGFGFKKADVDTLLKLNLNDAVNTVLKVDNTPSAPPVNYYENEKPDENKLPYGADWTKNPFDTYDFGFNSNYYRYQSVKYWLLGKTLNQDITIREKMTLFWYHFIPVDFTAVNESSNPYSSNNGARIVYDYMIMFRNNSTGNFKKLIREMATQPAMMFYLNNNANKKGAPDENFALEIMELFTIGKDNEITYAREDTVQAAKLLTGWRVENLNTANQSTNFIPDLHDTSEKQFSAFFGNTKIPNSGEKELDLFIDMIFTKQEIISQYICRRLYRFFVYYDIDAAVETNVIKPLAKVFVDNNWEILPVLDKLFKSEHFFDAINKGVFIKSPLDLIIGSFRNFNINTNVSDATNYDAQYNLWQGIHYNLVDMGQTMGEVPTVSGWQAFYQKPSFHEYWINSNTIQKRFGYIEYMLYGIQQDRNGLKTNLKPDLIAYVQQFSNTIIEDPNLLVNECVKYLLPVDLSLEQKNIIKKQTLLSNQDTDGYWSDAWINYIGNTTNTDFKTIVVNRLDSLIRTITQYAEFQLM